MTFPDAVDASARLRTHFRAGLGALGGDRRRVTMKNPRLISGSVNVEAAQRMIAHQDATWDYGIGITAAEDDVVVWLEVHSANSRHVDAVLAKLESLTTLLRDDAPALNAMPKRFIWLATDKVYISPGSTERRRINNRGLLLRSKVLDLGSVL